MGFFSIFIGLIPKNTDHAIARASCSARRDTPHQKSRHSDTHPCVLKRNLWKWKETRQETHVYEKRPTNEDWMQQRRRHSDTCIFWKEPYENEKRPTKRALQIIYPFARNTGMWVGMYECNGGMYECNGGVRVVITYDAYMWSSFAGLFSCKSFHEYEKKPTNHTCVFTKHTDVCRNTDIFAWLFWWVSFHIHRSLFIFMRLFWWVFPTHGCVSEYRHLCLTLLVGLFPYS